ncbi:hypothetical protein TL16_g07520 [Triparma laevis f. inornata]|uniref:Plastid lipid-associated protein/fibrillin conserved domain-containing protein n=2 Tax=Triparma laevis TaxID=1534972 RepID=A0A9W7FCY2_9STRA|nr:hypothetical protein TL16_g07520 [Triparma laevis f. inornata]GMI09823.1 hypothetical protein TrLO_g415 [Triparma laevis f. longispina]
MVESDDLTLSEFTTFWNAAPKFPGKEEVDVDGFEQIWRDISELFEDDDMLLGGGKEAEEEEKEDVDEEEEEEQELTIIFREISKDGYMDLPTLKEWDEVQNLLSENLISEREIDEIWRETGKAPGSENRLDVEGFLSFNLALDDLFYFDDLGEEEEEDMEVEAEGETEINTSTNIDQGIAPPDLPVSVPPNTPTNEVYSILTGNEPTSGLTFDDLEQWTDLKTMVDDGDVEVEELEEIFENLCSDKGLLDEKSFLQFDAAVEDLFEDADGDAPPDLNPLPNTPTSTPVLAPPSKPTSSSQDKQTLLSQLSSLSTTNSDPACLNADAPPPDILPLITSLSISPSNLLTSRPVTEKDLTGKWLLIYSNSGMIKFSRGLTGLATTLPNGKFMELTQTLTHNNYASDCLYLEKIDVGATIVEAEVDGDWNLRSSVSLLTGEACVIVNVEPLNVKHSKTTTRADHWKSVRCMNMLNLDYLDDDLRIMRGNTSLDTVFVWKRIE